MCIRVVTGVLALLAAGLTACSSEAERPRNLTPGQYVDQALDTLETYSLYRDSVDWDRLRPRIMGDTSSLTEIEQAYRLIARAVREMGDEHGFFRWPPPPGGREGARQAAVPDTEVRSMITGRAAYVSVPGFASGRREESVAFATELQRHLRDLDAAEPCGWIIDLRDNWGGSMWPMLAGLGALTGEGTLGHFIYPDGRSVPWTYRDGSSFLDGEKQVEVEGRPYRVAHGKRLIAVLLGSGTTSSGEAVAVALSGVPGTSTFGEPTAGMTTAIEGKLLADGAMLGVSRALFADRSGAAVHGPLLPEVEVRGDEASEEDVVRQVARRWVASSPECQVDARVTSEPRSRTKVSRGTAAPDLRGVTLTNDTLALSDLRGKFVLLDFWGTWCAPCVAEQPVLQRIHERYDDRLVILGIADELGQGPELLRTFVRQHDVAWPQMLAEDVQVGGSDADILHAYAVRSYPTKYLIGPDGTVLEVRQDELAASGVQARVRDSALEETLESLIDDR